MVVMLKCFTIKKFKRRIKKTYIVTNAPRCETMIKEIRGVLGPEKYLLRSSFAKTVDYFLRKSSVINN